ncbi:hypothetical protein EIJ81_00360 (plasmid) [Aliivibrio salmonicida]|uniref:hypothetical protein n=1 Tax=Aliivibrio salmonicida TaxID=40269 RepID=UPI000F6BBAB4|nr:hypothetical protein [Aliivibrio salmonicida]AZL83353.1 hypothetical protein EIJ81_00360 [Aliivibrio salmonicida]
MITIAPHHLDALKAQAYSIRDELLNFDLSYDKGITKSQWLSIYARTIDSSYADWNDLTYKTRNKHQLSDNTLIITPESIYTISKAIREELALWDLDLEVLVRIVKNAANKNEAEYFDDYKKTVFTPPDVIHLELGPKNTYQRNFLMWFFRYKSMKIEHVIKEYAFHTKELRKGVDKCEIKVRSLDVYPRSGQKIITITNELTNQGYLEEKNEVISLSDKGLWYCRDCQTYSASDEWKVWFKSWKKHITAIEYKQVPESWDHAIYDFYTGMQPDVSAQKAMWPKSYKVSDQTIRDYINQHCAEENPLDNYPTDRYFLFSPELMLTPNMNRLATKDITFEITQKPSWFTVPNPLSLNVLRHSRKRHYFSIHHDTLKGWISKIPKEVSTFELEYSWGSASGKFRPTQHKVKYSLVKDEAEPRNWLYNTSSGEYQCTTKNATWSFTNMFSLTEGRNMSQDELLKIPRIRGGITFIEMNKEQVTLREEREILANNSLMHMNNAHWV